MYLIFLANTPVTLGGYLGIPDTLFIFIICIDCVDILQLIKNQSCGQKYINRVVIKVFCLGIPMLFMWMIKFPRNFETNFNFFKLNNFR